MPIQSQSFLKLQRHLKSDTICPVKVIVKIVLVFILFFTVIGVGAYFFLPLDSMAKSRVEEVLGPAFSIGNAGVSYAHLEISDLKYNDSEHNTPGVIKVDRIKVYPSILLLLTGRIVIKKIEVDSPYLLLKRFNDNKWSVSKLMEGGSTPVILKGIRVKNGVMHVQDDMAGKSPFKAKLEGLSIKIENPVSVFQQGTFIDISGKLVSKKEGDFRIKGKWDVLTKKITANVKINELDMTILNPYLAENRDGVVITSGNVNISSDLKFENNAVNAPVDAVIKGLSIKADNGRILGVSVSLIKGIVEEEDGKISFKFNVSGTSGNIQTDLKDALKKKVEDSLKKKMESPIKRFSRDLKDIGKGILDVFR
ncbi:MAG TPA: hypothetical protein DD641_07560 [Deltaproteobacteria bacterium]|nr:hypothetical protein [Deltaproteobacteria bacterium]